MNWEHFATDMLLLGTSIYFLMSAGKERSVLWVVVKGAIGVFFMFAFCLPFPT